MALHNKVVDKQQYVILILLAVFLLQTKCSFSPPKWNRSELTDYISEDTNLSDSLLVGYDKRFIPRLPDAPLFVKLQVVVSDVLKIGDMEAELIIFIRQTWYDYRLSWNSTKERLKIREHFLDKIWLPDVRIVNLKDAKRFEGFGGVNMNIYRDGRIYFSQLVHVMTSCPMDLHRFPMDRQTCFLNFSSFAYGKSWLSFSPSGKPVEVRQHQLPQFYLVEAKELDESNNGGMAKFSVSLTFQRRAGYYVLQVYIPASFLVILSWLSFFMEATNIADRLTLEITMILSTVFLLDGINDSVTRVSYAKASDWYVITSFGFIFFALLETMLVYRLSLSEKIKAIKRGEKPSGVENTVEKQLSIVFMKSNEELPEENIELAKLKGQLNTGQDEVAFSRTESKVTVTKQNAVRSCSPSGWVDKICLVMFPTLYVAFNFGYWFHFSP
ncbi:gamma-aminobutyric acid receptor alpha-like [Dendronephthya gigantea]|uniref:gamma-aminobutyric acid receptor alpha-like n=1 Tax=Dendronephthya gigantea TaxID=151771 RepID=UPI00106ACDC7|nr:gamma-aminobutyric acid receptor alpha-like [Dendronephthya gigantea]